ncbi:MAG: hypothetical protein ABIP48_31000 [Planctomycetota bacterium]
MNPSLSCRVVWLAVPLAALAGCGAGSEQKPAGKEKRSNVIETAGLPSLGDYLPPLDDGRLELAAPKGWHFPPRSSKYVVRAQKSATEAYPSVVLTAEDYDGEGIDTVSMKNVETFAGKVAAAAKKDKSAVKPVEIGRFVGVVYTKRAKVRQPVTRILDLVCLETVVNGRKYRFELRSEEGSREKDQPYLYAVAKGIRFAGTGLEVQAEQKQPKEESEEEPKEEPQEKPKAKPDEKAKEKPKKKEGGLELDLDKLDDLLK